MKWLILLAFCLMGIRLLWYEVMVRALTRWIQHIDRIPNDAQIDYLCKEELKRLLTGR